jgi:hypothetical protein
MRVKVPRDLAGGSLLNAHRWVKSTMARENPGGSTDNYKIQETNGTPISLSDLTSRNFDEVLVISGTRSNPPERGALADRAAERGFIDANTSNYPVSSPDWRYPSYNDNNRIGNNIAKLLPKDIDSSMLNRLAAQNGMFSALNTTTKLLYTDDSHHLGSQGTDPQVAALLQTYANAQQKLQHPILTNPARTFFGPDMNEGYRGVLSPDEAVKVWAADKFKLASPRLESGQSAQLMDRARIIKMYDLDNPTNLTNFIDHVLTPYLVTSTANANLLKAMRHGDYHETTKKTLGRFKGDIAETPQWKKLLAMLPMHAIDFYDGKDYALIAHPVFQRQSLAIQAMDDNLIKRIMKIVKDHPDNANQALSPGQIRPVVSAGVRGLIERLMVPERREINNLLIAQQGILTTTDPSAHLELLRELYLGDSRDASIANSVRDMVIGDKVSYQRDVAGFRPTPPPYWPKPVVLAVMDALKENIHAFIEETDRFGMAFKQLASIPHMSIDRTRVITFSLGNEHLSISIGDLENLQQKIEFYDNVTIMHGGDDTNDPDGKLGVPVEVTSPGTASREDPQGNPLMKFPAGSPKLTGANYRNRINGWRNVRFIIAAYTKNPRYFLGKQISGRRGGHHGLTVEYGNEVKTLFRQMVHQYNRNEFNELADETLNLLTIFMEVEETARSKYNYAMTENDRAFVLYLLNRLFDTISVQPEWGDGSGDGGPGGRSDAEIVNVLRHMQGPDQVLTEDQLNNRLQFSRRLTVITNSLMEDARAGGNHEPTPSEINNIFDTLQVEFGQSPWARRNIAQERARALTERDAYAEPWEGI